jgi:drug/metabolite transporter (DMT)-like permease
LLVLTGEPKANILKQQEIVQMKIRTRTLALAEGIIAGVLFGTAAIFIRVLQNFDAFSIAFWRLIIAGASLAVALIVLGRSFNFGVVRKNLRGLCVLGLFLGLHFIFFASAVKDTTILNATVLVNTAPLFSVFVSSLFFKLKPSYIAVVGLTISFVGMCVIAYAEPSAGEAVHFSPSLKGNLEAVLAAVVESVYLNYGRKVRSQMNVFSIMIPIYLLAAVIVGILSLPVTATFILPTGVGIVLALVGLGVLPTAMAHTLYFSSLLDMKSFETASMALLEPIGASILAVFLFQEIPALPFILGAVLVLAGVFFVVRGR